MEKIAGCCLKFRQEKCIESGIKSGKVVWGHLHEICVVDGQVDEEMINAYKNEQKKRDFNNDLSKIHVLTQKSTKLASSTKSIDKIQLGMRGSSKNTPGTVLINRLFLFLSLSQKSDNCSVHKGSYLDAIYLEANIQVKYLPPNMTYILQVLDLVVNGPIKAHIHGLRAERIVEYFKEYKAIYDAQLLLPHERLVKPAWKPPKLTLQECMTHLCKLIQGKFTTSEFRAGITERFHSTGLCPDDRRKFSELQLTSDAGT
jgi:hypothetical protein